MSIGQPSLVTVYAPYEDPVDIFEIGGRTIFVRAYPRTGKYALYEGTSTERAFNHAMDRELYKEHIEGEA